MVKKKLRASTNYNSRHNFDGRIIDIVLYGKDDETPPTTPLLTILSINDDSVELAWAKATMTQVFDEYRLYRNSSVLVKLG